MPAISIADAKKNFYKICDEVNDASSPILITNDNGRNCYLIGEKDFNAILETVFLNSIEGLSDSIINEGNTSYDETTNIDSLDW